MKPSQLYLIGAWIFIAAGVGGSATGRAMCFFVGMGLAVFWMIMDTKGK